MFNKGSVIANRYELIQKLGMGPECEVFRARDLWLGEHVALKVLRDSKIIETDKVINTLKAEVVKARKLSHPNIVRVYDLGKVGGLYFITREYVSGRTLYEQLDILHGKFTVEELLVIAEPICNALDYAHDMGVIHGDIKPSNIMVSYDFDKVKLMDFGFGRINYAIAYWGATRLIIPPIYKSKEQYGGNFDRPGDIYSLSATFYHMLSGNPPFSTGEKDFDIGRLLLNGSVEPIKGVPEYVNSAILAALAKDPRERPVTAGEFFRRMLGEETLI